MRTLTLILLIMAGTALFSTVALADEPVPIGEVVADPDAYHFRIVPLEGTVRRVTPLPPYSPGKETTCYGAYTFMLEDETGSLEVSVLGICGTPLLRKPEVNDGERILLKAQILSPNRLTSTSKGEIKRLRALANEIVHAAPVPPPSQDTEPNQTEEMRALEEERPAAKDGKPEGDSGY